MKSRSHLGDATQTDAEAISGPEPGKPPIPGAQPDARPALDPDLETMRHLGYEMIDRVVSHLATLSDQPVGRRGTGSEFAKLVEEPLPASGQGIAPSLDFFFQRVVPDMTRVNHPRFHAYIPAPSSFAGALGAMIAAGINPFVGSWLGGATLSALEITVLRWIAQLLNYPTDSGGILTSGGSIANLVALAAARSAFGADILRDGTLYVSDQGHASMTKAADILGFPPEAVRVIDVDTSQRMKVGELQSKLEQDRNNGRRPFFVSANAGTTNTGAIDPIREIRSVCRRSGLWFHVDAAYGGFAAISRRGRGKLAGIETADSLTLDPHKWLYCPMGIGCVLVRNQETLTQAFSTVGDYLKDIPADEVNFFDRGPELSRPARALAVWMVIRSHGVDTLAEQIDEDIRLANEAAEMLERDGRFEVIRPQLSVVAFRHQKRCGESEADRSARDTELVESTLRSGELMLSSTLVNGVNTLRLVVLNHRTTQGELERSIRKICELAT